MEFLEMPYRYAGISILNCIYAMWQRCSVTKKKILNGIRLAFEEKKKKRAPRREG